jgi:hypothetical protein
LSTTHVVERPRQRPEQHDQAADGQQAARVGRGRQGIQAARDVDRQPDLQQGREGDGGDHTGDAPRLRVEVADDAPDQIGVAVVAVV